MLASRKGERALDRKPRKRGGKASKPGLSNESVPALVAADRSGSTVSAVLSSVCAAASGVSHEVLNQSAGARVRGDLHIQTVNSRAMNASKAFSEAIEVPPPNISAATYDGIISSSFLGPLRLEPSSPQPQEC